MSELRKKIGERIRKERKAQGHSNYIYFAEGILGMSPTTLQNIELGKGANIKTYEKVMNILGLTLEIVSNGQNET